MRRKIIIILTALIIGAAAIIPLAARTAKAENIDADAKAAILADFNTGTVVYEKNSHERLQIASMVKIMTLNIIFEEIDKGNLSYTDDIAVSQNASSMGGSQAFLDSGCSYKAEELIKSIIVASANDSCVAMAEHIAGSVENFVSRMNDKAGALAMTDTYFVNCTGLPAPNQYSCAADVFKMSSLLFRHKQFFDFSKIWMYELKHPSGRITELTNTNKLVRFYRGCDGGKTGFTTEALSCLSATAERGGTRLMCVVIGAPNAKTRNAEVSELFNYGFAGYETKKIISKGDEVDGSASVSLGKFKTVTGTAADDAAVFGKKGELKDITSEINMYNVAAPVDKGQKIGEIKVFRGGEMIKTVDIVSAQAVEKIGYGDIIGEFIREW